MLPKWLLALSLFAALAAMHAGALRAQSWQYTNGPYANSGSKKISDVIAFAKLNDTMLFAASDSDGLFRTSDRGDHWQQCWESPGKKVNCIAAKDSFVLIGTTKGLVRSTDGGATFDSAQDVFYRPDVLELVHDTAGIFYTVAGFSVGGSGSNIVCFRSGDGGITWDTLTSLPGLTPQALVVDSSNELLYVCYPPPNLPTNVEMEIWKSRDSGSTWSRTEAPYFLENAFVFAAAPNGDFYTYSNEMGILRANDSAYDLWGPLPVLGTSLVYARHFAFLTGDSLCMATADSLCFTSDRANTWKNISAPLNDFPSCEYAFNGDLFASSESGVIRVSSRELSVNEETAEQSTQPMLVYYYPGKLSVTTEEPGPARLDFLDVNGRREGSFQFAELPGGQTIIPLPVTLASGVYLARCQTRAGSQTCKFIVGP